MPAGFEPSSTPAHLPTREHADNAQLASEVELQLNKLWGDFEALKQPTREQMDHFVDQLLGLPPEATEWGDILHRFARWNHPDLPGTFHRIAAAVPHTKPNGMAFFYWAAAEEFTRHRMSNLLPEVAAGFCKLDVDSYDPDALAHVEDFLLAAGLETETLQLAEHFLPIERADAEPMPYAVPQRCNLIFELRVGESVHGQSSDSPSPEILAKQLRQSLEEEIHEDSARLAADITTGRGPTPAWTRSHFDLVTGDIAEDDQAWQDCLRLFGMLIRVAQEAWEIETRPPACAFRGLTLLLNSVYAWKDQRTGKSKKSSNNLLDYLHPSGLEQRVVQSCRDIIGINAPRARLLLQAHELLASCAARHQLISPDDAARTEKELSRLRRELDALA